MITKLGWKGFRGSKREIELAQHTLITGPNAVGKSTVRHVAEFCVLGKIPGFMSKNMIENSSDREMQAYGTFCGKKIIRTMTRKGEKVSESITIDGVAGTGKNAAALLTMALGKEPLVMNMPEIYEASSTQQRRMILNLVCTDEELAKLQQDEQTARELKNEMAEKRRGAEEAVKSLMESLREMEKPAGNLEELKKKRGEAEQAARELRDKIANGEANERAQAQIEGQVARIPELQTNIKRESERLKAFEHNLAAQKVAIEEIKQAEPDEGFTPSKKLKAAQKRLEAAERDMGSVTQLAVPPPSHVRYELNADAEKQVLHVLTLVNKMPQETPNLGVVRGMLDAMLPQKADVARYDKACQDHEQMIAGGQSELEEATELAQSIEQELQANHEATLHDWNLKLSELEGQITTTQGAVAKTHDALNAAESDLKSAKAAHGEIDKIGPGVDLNDRTTLEGLDSQITELDGRIAPIQKYVTIEQEVEKLRLKAEKAVTEEDEAKEKLQAALEAQAGRVLEATEVFASRSAAILPVGALSVYDDGKDVMINWRKPAEIVEIENGRNVNLTAEILVSRNTLSGSEVSLFDCAFGHALSPKATVMLEAAELDIENLMATLDKLKDTPFQVLVFSWYTPTATIPGEWALLNMG